VSAKSVAINVLHFSPLIGPQSGHLLVKHWKNRCCIPLHLSKVLNELLSRA
jgi:hypothetical protein